VRADTATVGLRTAEHEQPLALDTVFGLGRASRRAGRTLVERENRSSLEHRMATLE
jgi:hypothetical protein